MFCQMNSLPSLSLLSSYTSPVLFSLWSPLSHPELPRKILSSLSMDSVKMEKLIAMNKYRKIRFLQNLFQYCLTAFVVSLCFSKSDLFPALCSFLATFFSVTLPEMGAYVMNPKCLFVVCNVIVIVLVGESKIVGPRGGSPAADIYDEYVRRNQSIRRLSSMEGKDRAAEIVPEVSCTEGIVETGNGVGEEEEDGGGEDNRNSVTKEEEEAVEEENDGDEEEEAEKGEAAAAAAAASEVEENEEEEGEEEKEEEEEEEEVEEEKAEEEMENDEMEGEGDQEDGGLLPADELNKRVEDFIVRINNQRRMEARLLLCRG